MSDDCTVLSAAEIADVRKPIEAARTLPPRAFVDADFWQAERSDVFHAGWYAADFDERIPNAGDARACDLADIALVIVRQRDGGIRAFHNVCPYDGGPIVRRPVFGAERLRAFYHGWEYDLDGSFQRAPLWGDRGADVLRGAPELAGLDVDLVEVPAGVWAGIVFVNPSGGARSFGDYIAPLAERAADVDFGRLAMGRTDRGDDVLVDVINNGGNWKTVFENTAANILHESFVHNIYRWSDEVPRLDVDGNKTYTEIADRGLYGLAFHIDDDGATYPVLHCDKIRTRDGSVRESQFIVSLYPNLIFAVMEDHLHAAIMHPLGPDDCEMHGVKYYETTAATTRNHIGMRRFARFAWREATDEDAKVIAAIQARRRSPVATRGFFAPFWDRPHHEFTKQLVDDLAGSPTSAVEGRG